MSYGMKARPQPDPDCPSCVALSGRLDELEVLVAKLGAELTRLKGMKPKTSRTSSKPPSSDGPWVKRPQAKRASSGKQRGGQPGHAGKTRKPAAPEDVDEVKIVKPDVCGSCCEPLFGCDPDPRRHQITDIPSAAPTHVEYQLHALECSSCGLTTKAALPSEVHASAFGPNLSALIVLLSGEYRMSRRNIQRFVADSHGIEISLGAISNLEGRVSEGLSDAHAEALVSVAASPTKHLDETSWRESNKLSWAWTAVGEKATVFVIRRSRGSVVTRELIGEKPTGVIITDRYSGYSYIDLGQRQVCFAHLIRDFRRMAEGQRHLRWIGKRLLGLTAALFRLWHLHTAKKIDRAALKRWARQIRVRMLSILSLGATSLGYETPGLCRGILRTEPAMWTFVEQPGVEPTNNTAERAVRPLVIHRKTSLGSQSERGSRFIERMNTCSATLRRSGRGLAEFIDQVVHAVLTGGPAPKLLS